MGDAAMALVFFSFLGAMGYFKHQRKLMELQLAHGATIDTQLTGELQEIKRQIADLRDTTTRYDMSFDSALQRMESRMGSMEGRVTELEQGSAAAASHRG